MVGLRSVTLCGMRLLVCGDRNWSDYDLVESVLLKEYSPREYTVIISGGARGADSMAERFADEFGLPKEIYKADWVRYQRGAGPIRNHEMLDTGIDKVIAFHDDIENSKGTKHMVAIARAAGVPVRIVSHDQA